MEHLFTEKGKKYAVVNKIIGTGQIICREVMINKETNEEVLRNDVETLSENILYNSPVESYYDKRERELKLSYERVEKEYNQKTERMYKLIRNQDDVNKDFLQIRDRILKFCKSENEPFIQLIDFVTGNFSFAVVDGYDPELYSKVELFKSMERSYGMQGLQPRYASNSEEYRKLFITSYSDGSGSTHNEIYLFKTKKEANEKLKEIVINRIKDNRFGFDLCELAIKLGVKLPVEKIKEQVENAKKSLENHKKNLNNQSNNYQDSIKKWQEIDKKNK